MESGVRAFCWFDGKQAHERLRDYNFIIKLLHNQIKTPLNHKYFQGF